MIPALEQALARARAAYVGRLPRHLGLLRALLSEPETAQARTEAQRLAHRLKGTSGSHGLHKLSEGLGQLESMLAQQPALPLADLRAMLSAAEGASEARDLPRLSLEPEPLVASDPGRVLLVQLEPALSERCLGLLRDQPVEVFIAESLEEAELIAGSDRLDFVLLQTASAHNLPDSLERLRAAACNAALPIGLLAEPASLRQQHLAASIGVEVVVSATAPDAAIQEAIDQLAERSHRLAPKLLLVDDDREHLASLSSVLTTVGFRTRELSDPASVLEVLDSWEPDAVIVDFDMPGLRGHEVCARVRSSPRWQSLQILMLTARTDRATRLACYRAGCDDFISKPFDHEELLVRVQTRLARRQVSLRYERDPLSGLLLRQAFSLRSYMRASEARRHRLPLSICLLDLDHFQLLHDRYGQQEADRVVSALGRLLKSRLREEDIAARWGGEEFALALPHTDAAAADSLVQDIRTNLAEVPFSSGSGQLFHTSLSAGIASYPTDGASMEMLLAVADRRLHEAKRHGRSSLSLEQE